MININPHDYAESFIAESVAQQHARARGLEIGVSDVTPGVGAFLRHLAHQLSAQSVVEVGTSAGVGALWICDKKDVKIVKKCQDNKEGSQCMLSR